MAGTSCLRTASAQASRGALIRISSVLVGSDMAWLLCEVRGRAKGHEPDSQDTGIKSYVAVTPTPPQLIAVGVHGEVCEQLAEQRHGRSAVPISHRGACESPIERNRWRVLLGAGRSPTFQQPLLLRPD